MFVICRRFDDSLAPRHLTAPLTILSLGPRLAGTPSKGKR